MPRFVRQIAADRFIWLLTGAILLASAAPLTGAAVEWGQGAASVGIFAIFLLTGLKLDRREVATGLRNWRLQGIVFAYVFGAMAVFGLALSLLLDGKVAPMLAFGFLFLGLLPSTVQSATSYCAIAKGNVAASVVAAASTNIAGVVATPALLLLLASATGTGIEYGAIGRIASVLILPFLLGQIVQPWLKDAVASAGDLIGWADKIVIALIVYIAFSGAVVAGLFASLDSATIGWLAAGVALFLLAGFGGAWLLGRAIGLARGDATTLLFSGAQKSVAIGAPLASALFPLELAGTVILPLLLYHLAQLVVSAPIAVRLAEG